MSFPDEKERRPVRWYRSTLFTTFCVATTAFTCPGIFGALNGMGAGGGASPGISNAANAIVFGVLAAGSPLIGGVVNRISPKWALLVGTLGYSPYAAGLYLVDHSGADWLLLFGAVLLGISACFLWVSSGAILLGYSEEYRKGTAMSIKFAFQNLGGSLGGIIALALNVQKDYRGGVTRATYIALMTLMCCGWPFALLLPRAKDVQRTDGRSVVVHKQPSFKKEFKVLLNIIKQPRVFMLFPLMVYAQWFLSFQWQFNYAYFTVRARALNSTLFYLLGFIAALLMGQFLDSTRFTRQTRAKVGYAILVVVVGTSWILGQIVQVHYEKTEPTIDWSSHKYGLGAFTFALWGVADPLTTTYMFWLVGSFSNDLNETSFLAAIMNSVGSVGSTFGFVVSAMNFDYNGACALNLALFFISVPGLTWVVLTKVTESTHGTNLSGLTRAELTASESGEEAYAEKHSAEDKQGVQAGAVPL